MPARPLGLPLTATARARRAAAAVPSLLGGAALAATTLLPAPAHASWEEIDRQAVMAVLALGGGETALFRGVRVHDPGRGGGGASRAVCGEVWFDGTPDYARFVQPFGRFADRPAAEPIGLPLVADLTEPPARLDDLWASFCRDVPEVTSGEVAAAGD